MLDDYSTFGLPEDCRSEESLKEELKAAAATLNRLIESLKNSRTYMRVANDKTKAGEVQF